MKIVIIGGGPGGYVSAIRAAQLGAEVTLIEKEKLGGTCLNVGCIPTKVLLHTAELLETLKHDGKELGIVAEAFKADWDSLQKRKDKTVSKLVSGIKGLMKSNRIVVVDGQGKFVGRNIIEVKDKEGRILEIEYDKAIIATGSVPAMVPIPGHDLEGVITSNEALSLKEVPKSMCIIGGGVIGSEFASIYKALGCKVTIIEMLPEIIANMDFDIVKPLKEGLIRDGVDIYTDTKVKKIERAAHGLKITAEGMDGALEVEAQKVLLSVGRSPVTDDLGLEALGIKRDKGKVLIDKNMKTSSEDIYAIGDCTGGAMLAHVASAQGIVAAEAIMGKNPKVDFRTIPYCVYTKPELASVGMTEKQAKDSGYDVKTGTFPLYANGKSMIMNETGGIVKFVCDAVTEEVLGLHIAGPRATDLIVEGALAIRLEATINEIITTIHAHPTVGEALHEAAHGVHGTTLHI
ncbi:dihydrolipoyl dehydrogenase [Alkalibacter saccharofermentans]|uniref:Dihydrolipoyl dehydrogenase n=1 Tax=Alkalibacter saccharofermentans DSM 14828 TaxID=1120975 RepID=A0A1M4Y001_9FIRM|nr:dihydrolipoyl dehydrogenase [Alkalibacter saccharofermentans]SHE99009.1 dihydrolipoamide dehydrogenase [Alkalibacter saccharofermentans DSM 14828]